MITTVCMTTPTVKRYLEIIAEFGPASDTEMARNLGVARAMANTVRRFLVEEGRVKWAGYGPQPMHGRAAQIWELVDA